MTIMRTVPVALAAAILGGIALAPAASASAAAPVRTAVSAEDPQDGLDEMKSLIGKLAGSYEGEAAESWQRVQGDQSTVTTGLLPIADGTPMGSGQAAEAAG